jgi:mono/diheme cytochrome c family protein
VLLTGVAAGSEPGPGPTADERAAWIQNGHRSFDSFCATCHGLDARGEGPLAPLLTIEPTDLTRCAARRGGEFPTDAMHARIDGSLEVRGHGTAEMPSWGRILTIVEDPDDPDERARVWREIREIVLYLESIQKTGPATEPTPPVVVPPAPE